ncbi:hypothetical protein PtA15_17A135 [Puccinia triticina]|uniref:Inhibitor I9 domain-containing protein n=1 Tax=Puccinia triticina TaxID=208348 RepID=A0ABY7D7V1_9BASI|nr:uncharacterized protein PtA15_17A135 [Puccinia triticina]WAQ92653.1 hypothetical protein PtA15_17A135 [Puccinia triticina]
MPTKPDPRVASDHSWPKMTSGSEDERAGADVRPAPAASPPPVDPATVDPPHQAESLVLADKQADEQARPSPSPEPAEPPADYIITLRQDTTKEQWEQYKLQLVGQGAEIRHEYFSLILKGFAVALRPSKLQAFQQDPLVKHVEADQKVHI